MAIPPHAIASLKAAIRTRLFADPDLAGLLGSGIHETLPRTASPPFAVFGDATLRDNGASEAPGSIIELDLLVFARERGTVDALVLSSAIGKALDDPLPTLAGHHLVALEIGQTSLRHDTERAATRTVMRLRAFTEPL